MWFKIQIGAFLHPDANMRAKMKNYAKLQEKLSILIQKEVDQGFTKFLAGKMQTLSDAEEMKQAIRKEGIRNAFIVPYYKDKRINIVDVFELLAE